MKGISHKLPLKIFATKKKNTSLARALAASDTVSESDGSLTKTLDRLIRRLWTLKSSEVEHEIKSVSAKLEAGLDRRELDPVTLLRSITTVHRILVEGPPAVSTNSSMRATLHFFGKVGAEQSSRADNNASKRLYLLASQYSNLCHERLELYRVYGSLLSPDWSLSCLFSADERDNLLTLIPERDAGGRVLESSESPELTTKEPTKASTFGALKAFINHAVSLSLILSRVSSHVGHCRNWASEMASILFIDCRSNLKISLVMSVCVILDQLSPKSDLERYSTFVKNYPLHISYKKAEDETSVWSDLRQSAERSRKIIEKRFTRVSRGSNVSLRRLCGCQYAQNGGEHFLVSAAITALQTDIMNFYFDDDQRPHSSLTNPKVAYLALLKLHASSAPSSLKRVTQLHQLQDSILTFYDSVRDCLRSLTIGKQLHLLNLKTGSAEQVSKLLKSPKLASPTQPVEENQSFTTERNSSGSSSVLAARPSMIHIDSSTLECVPGVAQVTSFTYTKLLRRSSEDSSMIVKSNNDKGWPLEVNCDYVELHDCRQVPLLFVSAQSVVPRTKRAVPPSVGTLPTVHMLIKPELLPDRRMIVGFFDSLQSFLDAVKTAQITMLAERRRSLQQRISDSNPATPAVSTKTAVRGAATCRHRPPSPFVLASPPPARGRSVITSSSETSSPHQFASLLASRVSRGVPAGESPMVNRVKHSADTPMMSPHRVADVQTIRRPVSQQFRLERGHNHFVPSSQMTHSPHPMAPSPHPMAPSPLARPMVTRVTTGTVRGRPLVMSRSVSVGPSQTHTPISQGALPSVSTMGQYFYAVEGRRRRPARSLSASPSGGHVIEWSNLQVGELIGKGATAEVYRGMWQGTEIAFKKFRSDQASLIREQSIVFQLRHPNLVLVMGIVKNPSGLVSEFCGGGSLFSVLHGKSRCKLDWPQKHKIALDVAKGCNYLHTQGIIHRDLKSLNILLAQKLRSSKDSPLAKISDFGMSVQHPNPVRGMAGTFQWMAPEIVLGKSYNQSVDVFSFGIILYELATGEIPYEKKIAPVDIGQRVALEGLRPDLKLLPSDCPVGYQSLMKRCWQADPNLRPGFSEIIEYLSK